MKLIVCILFIAGLSWANDHGTKGIPPETALKWLKNGNARYLSGKVRRDGQKIDDIKKLSVGQHPHTIVLSCSDSRVPPEIVFDQKLGEIFVVRTAGEALDDNVIGSIEYAVEHLGSKLILVMGHSSCGAVKAALQTLGGQDAGSPSLNVLVKEMHPYLKDYQGKEISGGMVDQVWSNTRGVAKTLTEKSKILADKTKSGEIQIQPAVYMLDSGRVEF